MYQHKFSVLGNTQTLYYKKKLEGKQQTNKTEQQKKGKSAIKKKFLAAFCENLQSSTSSHLRHAHYKLKIISLYWPYLLSLWQIFPSICDQHLVQRQNC